MPALAELGIDALHASWSDPGIDWTSLAGVLIRSCWDYHLRLDEFRVWLAHLEALRVPLWNSAAVLRWNTDKRYLRDLASLGVTVAPTVWLARGTRPDVSAIARARQWPRVVVKPTVSASGWMTWSATTPFGSEETARFHEMLRHGAVMVQPFLPEVVDQGELSLIFLGGRFSHAVVKRSAPGEFRVQNQFGGTANRVDVSRAVVRLAERIVRAVPEPLAYARVDGVLRAGGFTLLELEVAEPSLFLGLGDDAHRMLAQAIALRARTSVAGRRRIG